MTDAQVRCVEIGSILGKLSPRDDVRLCWYIIKQTPQACACQWFIDFAQRHKHLLEGELLGYVTPEPSLNDVLTLMDSFEAEDRRRLLHDLVTATPEIAKAEWFQKINGEAQ